MNGSERQEKTENASAQVLRRYLQIGSASGPTVSHDGKKIAFLNNVTGMHQLWQVDESCPWPTQLTFGSTRVRSASFSPCGRYLSYSTDAGGNERTQIHVIDRDGTDRDLSDNPNAFHTFGCWSPDGSQFAFASNRREYAHFDVYIQSADGGAPQMVYEGSSYYLPIKWSPDGQFLLLWELRGNFFNRLYQLDIASGNLKEISPPGEQPQRYKNLYFSEDGEGGIGITDSGQDFLGIAKIAFKDGSASYIFQEEWDIEQFAMNREGTQATYMVNVDGRSQLKVVDRVDGQFQTPVEVPNFPLGVTGELHYSADGSQLVFTFHGPKYNVNIWSMDTKTLALKQVTFASQAGIDHSKFVEPKVVRYPSFDGLEIPGLLYIPGDYDPASGPLPVIVNVHGGPESQSRIGFASLFQYYLKRGYIVFAPNVRGSLGYGRHFADLDNTDKRLDSVKDLAACAQYLQSLDIVDSKRICVMGGSYGGYMTLAAVSMYPDYWAAGVDVVGIANLRTFIQNTGAYRKRWRVLEYGDPDIIGDYMDAASPIHHVDKIKAPLMVIHGANDPRVPQDEAEQIVNAMRERNMPVKYLLYADEGHGIAKLHNRIDCYSQVADFLDQYLGVEQVNGPGESS